MAPGQQCLKHWSVRHRYVRSLDSKQLGGKNSTSSACAPIRYLGGSTNDSLPNDGRINPFGLIAWSNFNDTFAVSADGRDLAIDVGLLALPNSVRCVWGAAGWCARTVITLLATWRQGAEMLTSPSSLHERDPLTHAVCGQFGTCYPNTLAAGWPA